MRDEDFTHHLSITIAFKNCAFELDKTNDDGGDVNDDKRQ